MTDANKQPDPQKWQGSGEQKIGGNGNDNNSDSGSPWWEKLSDPDAKVRQVGKKEWQQYQEEMFQMFHPLEDE